MIGFKETAIVVLLAAGLLLGHAAQAAGTVNPAAPNGNSYKPGATYGLGDRGPQGGKVYYVELRTAPIVVFSKATHHVSVFI